MKEGARSAFIAVLATIQVACSGTVGSALHDWSPSNTARRLDQLEKIAISDLATQAELAIGANDPRSAYLAYAMHIRCEMRASLVEECGSEDWLRRAASTPVRARVTVPRYNGGLGETLFVSQRIELTGLPEAQFEFARRNWDSPGHGHVAAERMMRQAAEVGYQPATDWLLARTGSHSGSEGEK